MRKHYKSAILVAAIAAVTLIPFSSAQAKDARHGVIDVLIGSHGYNDHDDYCPTDLSYSLSYSNRPWYSHHNHRNHYNRHHNRHINRHYRGHNKGHRNKHHQREHRGDGGHRRHRN